MKEKKLISSALIRFKKGETYTEVLEKLLKEVNPQGGEKGSIRKASPQR